MKTQPLVRVLTDAGYGSRRKVANLVKAGAVKVNGRLASSFTEPVDIESDTVAVSGQQVGLFQPQRIYLMMNKPMGALTTTEDDRGRQTVMDLLPEKYRNAGLYPAGRLDEDSTGLLILTNDGDLTHELTHPRYEHEKEYEVAVSRALTDKDYDRLHQGIEIEEQLTWPARVHAVKESEDDEEYVYSITIHEGRKRQVRRMFQALVCEVTSLKRVRMGSLVLGDLPEGEFRELKDKELKALMHRATAPDSPRQRPTGERQAHGRSGFMPARLQRQQDRKPPTREPEGRGRRDPTERSPSRATSRPYSTGSAGASRAMTGEANPRRPGGTTPYAEPRRTPRRADESGAEHARGAATYDRRPVRRPDDSRTGRPEGAARYDRRPARRPDDSRTGRPEGAARYDRRPARRPGEPGTGRPRRTAAYEGRDEATQRRTVQRPGQSRFSPGPATGGASHARTRSQGSDGRGDRRVDRTPTGKRDFEGSSRPERRRPSASGTSAGNARRTGAPDTDRKSTRPSRAPRPRGQVSRQRPGASQPRRRPEQKGPARPRRTSPTEGRRPPAERR